MSIKSWVKRYFGFSRAETNGFLILLPLMAMLMISEPVYRLLFAGDFSDIAIEHLLNENVHTQLPTPVDSSINTQVFFSFNPNAVSEDSLRLLGFSAKLASRLINYRQKGGRFYSQDDLLKLYGMSDDLFEQIRPWIVIPSNKANSIREKPTIAKVIESFDLNYADSITLRQVKGIGLVLAKRIIRYRESLGGFINVEQLRQVYGLDSATVTGLFSHCFIEGNFIPRKLNLNEVDEKLLSNHPYMSKADAKIIVMYILQHGKFTSLVDLKKIHGIKEGTIDRILPYLEVD
jgi:DNA uptake protein ComE-like DNA-binding protein